MYTIYIYISDKFTLLLPLEPSFIWIAVEPGQDSRKPTPDCAWLKAAVQTGGSSNEQMKESQ